jgi:multidrug transporter EmrE-like cation transporter
MLIHNNNMSLAQISLLSLVEIVGDFGLKKYAHSGKYIHLLAGVVGYIGVVIMLIICFKESSVLLVNAAWDGTSALIESVAAFVFLEERFDHFSQYGGVLMIVLGLYLLKIPIAKKRELMKNLTD